MTDPLDIYNNTASDIVCAHGTVPASSFISIAAGDAVAWAKDPIVVINIMDSSLGVSVYGIDLSYGLGSAADIWIGRVANGQVVY